MVKGDRRVVYARELWAGEIYSSCSLSVLLILLQNVDEIHMLEGACSLAATGASSVKGGNFQIFENFLGRSDAKVHLNTTVCTIRLFCFYRF